jgi:hypothetical protein
VQGKEPQLEAGGLKLEAAGSKRLEAWGWKLEARNQKMIGYA